MTQAELAERSGLGQTAWSKIERGATIPNVEVLAVVARILGRRASDLLAQADAVLALAETRGMRVLLRRDEEDLEAVQSALAPRALAALIQAVGAPG